MMGLVIIFVACMFGLGGGFLAVHFYFNHHYFVTTEKLDDVMASIVDCIQDGSKVNDALVSQINDLRSQLEEQKKKMDDHYRWTMTVWNGYANFKESVENPIPETLQEVAREEVQLSEEDAMPMGPVDENWIEEAKKEFEQVDPSLGEAVDQEKFIKDVVDMLKRDAIERLEKDIEFKQFEMQVAKECDPVDIKTPDRVKPMRQDKKKKGKKNGQTNTDSTKEV